jgi:hypothetical protein
MQQTIDNFRSKTGGNLTTMSYEVLKNSTLVFSDQSSKVQKRALDFGFGDSASSPGLVNSTKSGTAHVVHGIEAFAESLLIPSTKYTLFEPY